MDDRKPADLDGKTRLSNVDFPNDPMIGRKKWSPQNRVITHGLHQGCFNNPFPIANHLKQNQLFYNSRTWIVWTFWATLYEKTCLTNQLAQCIGSAILGAFLGHPIFGGLKITGGDSMFYMFYLLKVFLTTICSRWIIFNTWMDQSLRWCLHQKPENPPENPWFFPPKTLLADWAPILFPHR